MARNTTNTSTEAKAKRGPQKRSLHIFYKADGNGGVEIVNVMTDARKVLEYVDSPEYKQSGLQRFKFDLVSEPRGSKGEDGSVTTEGEASGE